MKYLKSVLLILISINTFPASSQDIAYVSARISENAEKIVSLEAKALIYKYIS